VHVVRPWKRGRLDALKERAVAFTASVFMQISIKRSSFPTTHNVRLRAFAPLCRSKCSLTKSAPLLIIIRPLEFIRLEHDVRDLTSLLPASVEGERLSKVTIRLFAEVVSPDNNDIIGGSY